MAYARYTAAASTMITKTIAVMGLLTLFTIILLLFLPIITTTYDITWAEAQTLQANNSTQVVSLPELYSEVKDSVVQITSTDETGFFALRGSGFIYDTNGHIITSTDAVSGNNAISVTFSDGTVYGARVMGYDQYSNLAVLRLEDNNVPANKLIPLPLGNSTELKIGEQVATIGSTYGGLAGVLTVGVVAQTGALIPTATGPLEDAEFSFSIPDTILTDLLISSPGSSGAPLFNMKGEVMGITVAAITQTSFSYSIPSNAISKIAPVLIERGFFEHPWLGVSGRDITPVIAEAIGLVEPRGFLVTHTSPGGPADTAGVQGGNVSTVLGGRDMDLGGDVILAINDHDIRKLDDILVYLEQATQVGETVTLTVWRNGQIIDIDVTVGSRPSLQDLALTEDNATATAVQEEEEWLLYENTTYGVRMLYPSTWTQQDSTVIEGGFVFVSDFFSPEETDGSFAAVSIGIDNMPPSTNLEDNLNETVNNLMQGDPPHQISSSSMGNFTLVGMPAYSLETTYIDPEFGAQHMLFVETIVDNKGYSITYIAEPHIYQKYLPVIEEMISSLELSTDTAVLDDAQTTEPLPPRTAPSAMS
jgi:S1-C subfamily serine protease